MSHTLPPLQTPATRVIYITLLNTSQVSDEEKQTIAWISAKLGEKSWQDALIIFTDAHAVKPARNFASILKQRTDMLRTTIAAQASWDIASSIATVTINAPEDPLTTCQQWLQEHHTPRVASTYLLILTGTREIIALPVTPHDTHEQQQSSTEHILAMIPFSSHCYRAMIGFYLSSVPLAAVGLFVAGILGYEIAMLINMLFWMMIHFLEIV
jgi:uncharacterized protein (DUF1501 family)